MYPSICKEQKQKGSKLEKISIHPRIKINNYVITKSLFLRQL